MNSREIKFRAKNINDRKLYYSEVTGNANFWKQIDDGILLDPQQFTGLLDKQNKEIYEGDICRIDSSGAFPPYGENGVAIRKVEWWSGQFVFNANRYSYMKEDDYINFGWWVRSNDHQPKLKQIEVIGDIVSNPELLPKE